VKTARQEVLEYIRSQRAATASELSQTLQMTEANARHHLGILVEEGLVVVIGKRSPGRGRPVKIYGLSPQVSGNNLDTLADGLLDMLLVDRGEDERPRLLEGLARFLLSSDSDEHDVGAAWHGLTMTQRLYQAVRRLNQLHYEARWEAHAFGPRLFLGRCPYTATILKHPELCQMDRFLLEQLVGNEVAQIAKLLPDRRGIPHCAFVVKK
jgi:predicted ArsR family transcriptional regulator